MLHIKFLAIVGNRQANTPPRTPRFGIKVLQPCTTVSGGRREGLLLLCGAPCKVLRERTRMQSKLSPVLGG